MNIAENRRQNQLLLLQSTYELQVGSIDSIPFTKEELSLISRGYKDVVEVYDSGCTAIVYKVQKNGKLYNVKKKRKEIAVQNVDGQTSFLTEVQRRYDFERLRHGNKILRNGLVKTYYASFQEGIIVSEWIDGHHPTILDRHFFQNLFTLVFTLEQHGFFDWDLSMGNILVHHENVTLFDFGYCYPFDSLHMFNPDGLSLPQFHFVERFESRSFVQYLYEYGLTHDQQAVTAIYRIEKEEALAIYQHKLDFLVNNQANKAVIHFYQQQIQRYKDCLRSDELLWKDYILERCKSYIIELHDDLSGHTCTKRTLNKCDQLVLDIQNYEYLLKEEKVLSEEECKMTLSQLLERYKEMRKEIIRYQF